ncbi:MAG: AAA family ATPase [Polyangiales bacterium]
MRRREPSTLPSPSSPGPGADREFSGTERFQLIRHLGMGGMGIVYEALDRESGEKVALKTLRNVDGTAILLLKQEFRTLAGLHHPNLIRLGELVESRGDWFFTMELLDGVSLMEWLRAGNQQRLRDALSQLVTGLGVLHDAGRIHRDIKPSNVMVSAERVVLVDFGLAIRHDNDSASWHEGGMVGTPAYMAPEQASGVPAGPEADFYSLGVILYEALTGKLPVDGPALQMMMQKQRVVPPAPSTLADVPADLDALCCALLQIDPAARPARNEIFRALGVPPRRNTPAPPLKAPLTPSPRPTFVGRDAELAVLKDAMAECDRGGAVNLLIEGESGMGKSALAEHFLAGLDRRDVVVLRGRCYERESVPYKGIDGVIDSISRFMARLPDKAAAALLPFHINLLAEVFPVLRGVRAIVEQPPVVHVPDPHEERRRVFAAVRELLARIGARHPLVILIDDLHWADADSLALLDTVMREPESPCLLLVSTAWPRGADEPALEFGGDLRRIVLSPLGERETAELAQALFTASGASGVDAATAIARESAGHPMFVAELVRHSVLHGGTTSTSDEVRLDDVLAARTDALEPAERELLELVATAGQPLPLEVAARALGVNPSTLIPLVGYLQTATLLRATGRSRRDSVEIYHDRTRRAVVTRSAERKPGLHRRLAVALEATDAETQPMLVGVHWEQAGEPARAAALYARAGDRATEAFAFERAVNLYERCLTLAPEMSGQLRRKLGEAYANAGRGREAADVFLALASESKLAADALELEQKAAHELLRAGHIDDGMEVLDRLLASVGIGMPSTPRRALASLLWRRARLKIRGIRFKSRDSSQLPREDLARMDIVWSAACGLSMTDWIHGAAFQALNLLLALDAGESLRVRRALFFEACHTAASGDAERAERLVAAATSGPELEDPYLRGWLELARGYIAYFRGAWSTAIESSERADALFSGNCANVVWERNTVHALSKWALVYRGSLKQLGQVLPLRHREAEEQGNLYALTTVWASNTTLSWIARDEVAAGRAVIAQVSKRWSLRGYQLQHWNEMMSNALFDIYSGDVLAARQRVVEGFVPMSQSLLTRIQIVRFEVNELLARTALAAAGATSGAERKELLDTAEHHIAKLAREPLPWMKAITLVRRGCLRAARGDSDGAVREFRAAMPACDATEIGLYSAATRVRLGGLIGGDEGRALRDEGRARLVAEEIKNPEAFVALYAP